MRECQRKTVFVPWSLSHLVVWLGIGWRVYKQNFYIAFTLEAITYKIRAIKVAPSARPLQHPSLVKIGNMDIFQLKGPPKSFVFNQYVKTVPSHSECRTNYTKGLRTTKEHRNATRKLPLVNLKKNPTGTAQNTPKTFQTSVKPPPLFQGTLSTTSPKNSLIRWFRVFTIRAHHFLLPTPLFSVQPPLLDFG